MAVEYPYSRATETEADDVGLQLAAKACVDVRQAVSFWKRLDEAEKAKVGLPPGATLPSTVEYFMTHPSHEKRWRSLEGQLESALMLRDDCQCPALGPLPRELSKNLVLEKHDHALHIRIL